MAATITPLSPLPDAVGITKSAPIKFTVVDAAVGVAFATVKLWVNGELIYSNQMTQSSAWTVDVEAVVDGREYLATPTKRIAYYRNNETVLVRVFAENTISEPTNEPWSFDTIRNLPFEIYPMILGSLRDKDEEN